MDKIFSARIDEGVVQKIATLAQGLRVSKKKVIEAAIEAYAVRMGTPSSKDAFSAAYGAWKRDESVSATVARSREAFESSMKRHQG